MNLQVTAKTLQGAEHRITLAGIPDTCPRCHLGVHPNNVANHFLEERTIIQAVFRCTSQKCQELFIGTYIIRSAGVYTLTNITPKSFKPRTFSDTIMSVSPSFVEIFNQAISAEATGLSEIVGIGLRKSLEFIIKDFVIGRHPADSEKVKAMFLAKVIEAYIDDSNLKECAKRAIWLGNDETHYVRKWEDKDINDLKTLIHLTVNWIENVLLTEKYISSMTVTAT